MAALVCAWVAAAHWPVLSAQALAFDDEYYLFSNPTLMNPGPLTAVQVLTEVADSSHIRGYYEGLTLLSLMADVAAGGTRDNLRPFHRTSLALHVVNTLLLIILLWMLLGVPWAAALAGLLFGLHPLTVEPVAWVWERKTVLATALVLGSLILYVAYVRRSGLRWYMPALGLFALALMAKPTVTPLPVLLMLLDVWPLGRLTGANRREVFELLLEKVPFLLVSLGSAAITMLSMTGTSFVQVPGDYPAATIPLRVSYLALFYLGKILWPAWLTPVYLLPQPVAWSNPVYVAAVIGVLVLAAGLILLIRRAPAVPAGVGFLLIAILPTLGIVQYSWVVASDKYVYFPAIGAVLIVAWLLVRLAGSGHGLADVWRSRRCAAVVASVAMLAVLETAATRRCLGRWQDTERLARHMIALAPQSEAAYIHLGAHLLRTGRHTEALEAYEQALRINPHSADANYDLGVFRLRQGDLTAAVRHLRAAVAGRPHDPAARMQLGLALLRQNDLIAAGDQFVAVSELRPEWPEPHINLGHILFELGQFEGAAAEFQRALAINPDLPLAYRNLGHALARMNRHDEAIAAWREALQREPDSETYRALGDVLAGSGRQGEALTAYQHALQIAPPEQRAELQGLARNVAASSPAGSESAASGRNQAGP